MEQFLKKTLLILFVSLLSSCSNLPSFYACKELSLEKAYCINTTENDEFYVDEINKFEDQTWWEQRHKTIVLPASQWAKLKKWILKQCERYGKCEEVDEVVKKVENNLVQ